MPRITKREAARRDLVDYFAYLAEESGIETAERFLSNAEASFNLLASQPNMGAPLSMRRPELAGLRKWSVDGFENLLIFYLPRNDGISVVRVLHGSRNWWELLGFAG